MAAIHSDEFQRDAVRIAQARGLTRRQGKTAEDIARERRALDALDEIRGNR
ncbi:MAG: hypothetical protein ACK4L4_02030 [Gemmobacter sp.]